MNEFDSFFSAGGLFDNQPTIPADMEDCLPKFNLRMGMFQGTTRVQRHVLMYENGANPGGSRADGIPRIIQHKMRAIFTDLRAMCECPVRAATDGMFVDSVRARTSGKQGDVIIHSPELKSMIKPTSNFVSSDSILYPCPTFLHQSAPEGGRSDGGPTDRTDDVLTQQVVFNQITEDETAIDTDSLLLDANKENIPPVNPHADTDRIHAINIRGRFPGTSNSVSIYIFNTGMVKVSGGTSDGRSRITGATDYEKFINDMVITYGMNRCAVFLSHLGELPPLHIRMINAVAKMSEQTRVAISEPSVFGIFRDIMTSEAGLEGTVFKSVSLARTSTSQLVIRMDDDQAGSVTVYGPGTVKISRSGGSVWFAGFRSVDCILSVMRMLDELLRRMSGGVFSIPVYLNDKSLGIGGAEFDTGQLDRFGNPVVTDCDPTWLEYRVRANLTRTTQRINRANQRRSAATVAAAAATTPTTSSASTSIHSADPY
jgi:hypothetical protein